MLKDWSEPPADSLEAAKLQALQQLPSTDVFELCPECRASDGGEAAAADAASAEEEERSYGALSGDGSEALSSAAGWAALLVVILGAAGGYAFYVGRRRASKLKLGRQGTRVPTEEVFDEEEGGAGGPFFAGGAAIGRPAVTSDPPVEHLLPEEGALLPEEGEEQEPTEEVRARATDGMVKERTRHNAASTNTPPRGVASVAVATGGAGSVGVGAKCAQATSKGEKKSGKREKKPAAATGSPHLPTPLAPAPAAIASCGVIAVGARVRVHGLKSSAQHNGLEGVVAAQAETPGGLRLNVACSSGEKLRLKAENLQVLE